METSIETTAAEDLTGVAVSRDELIALGRSLRNEKGGASGRRVLTPLAGSHASAQHGPGMAFSEVRAYQPGDDVRAIDWRVTARTGRVHSKLFEAERERPVWLGVDLSGSMRFATQGSFKSVVAARRAASLAWEAFAAGERVGAVVWSPAGSVELPAGRTRRHLMRVLAAVADATAAPSLDDPGSGLEARARWLRERARTGSRVVLLSDFYDLDDGALGILHSLARRCELRLVWIYDPIEADAPPPGRYRVSDGQVTDLLVARENRRFREAYRAVFRHREETLERFVRESGAVLERRLTNGEVDPAATGERRRARGGRS